jgi:hypothetical protein
MAYLARIEPSGPHQAELSGAATEARPTTGFSPLEWSIIRLSRTQALSSIRKPGPIRRLYHWLIGQTASRRLANDRLEALRRIAVLSWHFGFSAPAEEVADFLSAGFTPEQYELLVTSVRAAPQLRAIAGEVLA